jgi:hypothetical protein
VNSCAASRCRTGHIPVFSDCGYAADNPRAAVLSNPKSAVPASPLASPCGGRFVPAREHPSQKRIASVGRVFQRFARPARSPHVQPPRPMGATVLDWQPLTSGLPRVMQGLFPDCGRIAGLNRVGTGAYSSDVRAATNFRGAEKSRVWLGGRYSVARWRNGSSQGFHYRA